MPHKEYIGDSVYAEHNGFELVLTTDNGLGPTNTIILDDYTWHALKHFMDRVYQAYAEAAQSDAAVDNDIAPGKTTGQTGASQ